MACFIVRLGSTVFVSVLTGVGSTNKNNAATRQSIVNTMKKMLGLNYEITKAPSALPTTSAVIRKAQNTAL